MLIMFHRILKAARAGCTPLADIPFLILSRDRSSKSSNSNLEIKKEGNFFMFLNLNHE